MFDVVRKVPLPEYGGEGILYRHKSGMEVFHVKNGSGELTCDFMFATPSEDDTGVAHILEHTVLCGSSMYPVKDPFSLVYQSSPNTFLNAMTFPDKTCYPLSSPLEKDFRILFRIYADAVFAPLLRKESFLQEGIRRTEKGFDGVVFNEMSDFSSEDSRLQYSIAKALFDGTCVEKESGGNPLAMTSLTYDEYKSRYAKWYNPANCRLFLFGDMDAQEYLDWIEDHYLANATQGRRFETKAEPFLNRKCLPFIKTKCATKDSRSTVVSWLTTPSSDTMEVITLTVLVGILLGNAGSPLYRAITESDLGEDLSPLSGMEADYPVMPFTVGFCGAKKGKEKQIESFLTSTIERLATEGLDPFTVSAAMKRQEFALTEIRNGSTTRGVKASLRAARTWLRGGSPEDGILFLEAFDRLRKRLEDDPRYFEKWMMEHLVDNPRHSLVVVETDPDFDSDYAKTLKGLHSFDDGAKADMERFDAFAGMADSKEALATIERISVADLPARIPSYDRVRKLLPSGVGLTCFPQDTCGIVYLHAGFDVSGLDLEKRKLLPVLLRFLTMCGTDDMDYTMTGNMLRFYTGSVSYNISCGESYDGKYVSLVVLRAKMLEADLEKALELIGKIIARADFSDRKRIDAVLTDIKTDFESDYLDSAHMYANMASLARFNRSSFESELFSGTQAWMNVMKMKARGLAGSLSSLRDDVFRRDGLKVQVSCRADFMDRAAEAVASFAGNFPETGCAGAGYEFKPSSGKGIEPVVYTVSSGPSYNAVSFPMDGMDDDMATIASLYSGAISDGILWDTVRGKTGAYGAGCTADIGERMFMMCSYRDPCVRTTFDNFRAVVGSHVPAEQIEFSKVTIVGKELRPLAPGQRAEEVFKRDNYSYTDAMYARRRNTILSATEESVDKVRSILAADYDAWCSKVSVCSQKTACSEENLDGGELRELPI